MKYASVYFDDIEVGLLAQRLEALPDPAAARKKFIARQPMGRFGTPEEIAGPLVFLVSDLASFMTGQILRPNGGVAMPW